MIEYAITFSVKDDVLLIKNGTENKIKSTIKVLFELMGLDSSTPLPLEGTKRIYTGSKETRLEIRSSEPTGSYYEIVLFKGEQLMGTKVLSHDDTVKEIRLLMTVANNEPDEKLNKSLYTDLDIELLDSITKEIDSITLKITRVPYKNYLEQFWDKEAIFSERDMNLTPKEGRIFVEDLPERINPESIYIELLIKKTEESGGGVVVLNTLSSIEDAEYYLNKDKDTINTFTVRVVSRDEENPIEGLPLNLRTRVV